MINAHERAVLAALDRGPIRAEELARLAGEIGGRGRVHYCVNQLISHGYYNRFTGAVTEKGRQALQAEPLAESDPLSLRDLRRRLPDPSKPQPQPDTPENADDERT